MRKAQNKRDWLRIITFTLLLAILAVTGCTSKEAAPVSDQGPVEMALAEVQATEEAAVVNEKDSTEAVVDETAVPPQPADECLACHIDKEMLIATAAPEEVVISENEGEG